MDELVGLVSKKTGISEEMAEKAVNIVLDYLKDKLPPSIADRLDSVIEGGGDLGGLADMAGGLFGKK